MRKRRAEEGEKEARRRREVETSRHSVAGAGAVER